MPAHTAERLAANSAGTTCGYSIGDLPTRGEAPAEGGGWGDARFDVVLVRGKLPHRLRDLLRIGHEELLLRGVERHGGDVRRGDPHDRPVKAVESMLRDDGRDLSPKPASDVVLVDDHRLAGLANRLQDRVTVQGRQAPEVDDLDAHAFGRELLRGLEAVMRHQAPRKTAQPGPLTAHDRRADRHQVIALRDLLGDEPIYLLVFQEQNGGRVADGRLDQ